MIDKTIYPIDLARKGQIDFLDTIAKRQAKSTRQTVQLGTWGILNQIITMHGRLDYILRMWGWRSHDCVQNSWVVGQSVQLVQEAPRGLIVILFPFTCFAFSHGCLKQLWGSGVLGNQTNMHPQGESKFNYSCILESLWSPCMLWGRPFNTSTMTLSHLRVSACIDWREDVSHIFSASSSPMHSVLL